MSCFNLAALRRMRAPQPELSCSWLVWRRLRMKLRERSCDGSRESGAFLLGHRRGSRARVIDFVLYDDLDPQALSTGIVRFDGRYFGDLWACCKARGLTVVADVHVHPEDSAQSDSDRQHPMICQPGHIALIIPRFAAGSQRLHDIGVHQYLGGKQWAVVPPSERRRFLHIGLF